MDPHMFDNLGRDLAIAAVLIAVVALGVGLVVGALLW